MLEILSKFWNLVGNYAFQQRYPTIPTIKQMQERFAKHLKALGAAMDARTAGTILCPHLQSSLKLLLTHQDLTAQEKEIFQTISDDLAEGSKDIIAFIKSEKSSEDSSLEAAEKIIEVLGNRAPDFGTPKCVPSKMETGLTTIREIYKPVLSNFEQLILAVKGGDIRGVNYLLGLGVNPNQFLPEGFTPLIIAAIYGQTAIVGILLQKGADVNLASLDKKAPLMFAVDNGHIDIIKKLLEYGARINETTTDGTNALIYAIANKNEDVVSILLQNHADANLVVFDKTPLMFAVDKGHIDIIKKLLVYGARVNVT